MDLPYGGGLDRRAGRTGGGPGPGLGADAAPGLHPASAPAPRRQGRRGGPGRLRKGGLAAAVAAAHPDAAVQVWAEDEHCLFPVVRRAWAPRGRRPVAPVRRRHRWLQAYGFVQPATGRTWWCLLPTVSAEAFSAALAAFAREEGIGAGRLRALEGMHLAFLSPHSPERQPAERPWGPLDEPVANRAFADLDELEAVLADRCRHLEDRKAAIGSRCRYHWWPRERRRKRPQSTEVRLLPGHPR